MEYKIVKSEEGYFGVSCNNQMVVPCKYRSIKPIEGTGYLLVEGLSGIVVNSKYIPAKNVLDINNGFVPMFDENFYFYDIINYNIVPKKGEGLSLKKITWKPYKGSLY